MEPGQVLADECDQDKQNACRFRADLTQLISQVFVARRCSSCLLAGRGQNAGAEILLPGRGMLAYRCPETFMRGQTG